MLKNLTVALVLTAGTFATLPATASAQDSRVVRYDDLDLSTKEGVTLLNGRINQAARSVCGFETAKSSPKDHFASFECVARARYDARRQAARIANDQALGG